MNDKDSLVADMSVTFSIGTPTGSNGPADPVKIPPYRPNPFIEAMMKSASEGTTSPTTTVVPVGDPSAGPIGQHVVRMVSSSASPQPDPEPRVVRDPMLAIPPAFAGWAAGKLSLGPDSEDNPPL